MKKFSRYLLLSFVSLAIIFVAFIVMANRAKAACGGDTADFVSSGEIDCGDETYKYDPVLTLRNGFPSFVEHKGTYIVLCENGNAILRNLGSPNVCQTGSGDPFSLGHYERATEPFTTTSAGNTNRGTPPNGSSGGPFCSMLIPNNCQPWNGNDYDDFQGGRDSTGKPNFFRAGPTEATATMIANVRTVRDKLAELETLEQQQDSCEEKVNSPLSFIMCPVMNFMTSAITTVIEGLQTALTNPDLTQSTQLADALRAMINVANSFYIIIFLVIIFANFIAIPGLDNYTIKKTLPKLIAAIILTQFSLLICQTILDLGNILAVTLPTLLLKSFGINGTPAQAFANAVTGNPSTTPPQPGVGNLGDLFESIGQFFMLMIVLLAGIIVGIIAFFYLVMRYFFIVLLVLATPFAFAAWVLPNTEQFFKKWWSMFIKLSLMYLLVTLLFTGGAIFSLLLLSGNFFGNSGGTNFLSSLVGIFVPLVVLALVPKTLKLSGDIMAKTGKMVAETRAGQKAQEGVKKSAQEGKLAEAKGKAYEGFGKSGVGQKVLGGKRAAKLEAKGAGLKDKSSKQLKEDIGSLGLDRQIELSKTGKGEVKKEALKAVQAKQSELNNKRVLSAQDAVNLARIEGKTSDQAQDEVNEGIIMMDANNREQDLLKNGADRVIEDQLIASGAHNRIEATLTSQGMNVQQARNEAINRVKQQARAQVRTNAETAAKAAHTEVEVGDDYKVVGDANKGLPVVNSRFKGTTL